MHKKKETIRASGMDDCIDLCSSSEEEGRGVPAGRVESESDSDSEFDANAEGGVESESDSEFDENAEGVDSEPDSESEKNGKGHGVNDNGHGKGGVPGGVAEPEFDSEIGEHDKGLEKNTCIGSRCSVKKMYNLIHGLDEEKKGYVREIGFGGLLLLPKLMRTNRHFLMWLLSKVDEEASSIITGYRRDIPFHDKDVETVLGIPCGGAPVQSEQHGVPENVIAAIRKTLGISESERDIGPVVAIVKKKVSGQKMTKAEISKFKIAFVICAATYLFAPTMKNDYFVTDYWGALTNPDIIHLHNWSGYVRSETLRAAKRVKADLLGGSKKSNLSGCLPFIQTFYLDNLEVTGGNIPHDEFPRIQFYTMEVINAIVEDDTRSRKGAELVTYGRLLPRHEALVCYQRNPANRNNVAGASNVFNRSQSRCAETGSMTIDEIESLVMDKVSSFATACEYVLTSFSRKKEEENQRHQAALADLENQSQQQVKNESRKVRDQLKILFAGIRHQDGVSWNMKGKRPLYEDPAPTEDADVGCPNSDMPQDSHSSPAAEIPGHGSELARLGIKRVIKRRKE
ncbi:hypothetical protein CFC21_003894 [Triticum aestivum]|uniref:Uncharacterized protein n=1 Tax=Triticum aestivum TaxID=4565 RepID=A0A3B5Y5M6_WHEAT|nr:uncharacterized protein LOC123067050 [Triticum aestivum]XP_044345952.1 uncharacterized protein LOC123067050 [Triticum aestivum]XP_044345956.1 uncharacterized protein LOC123067050 [Triticum aestivum]XP_044345959.1 uncharacterized protein LOC123067050 [Triticum aestivum]XP_044345962.1 uncharacterized protein LOC123067050 [Triticum aestivum]KAF6986103.1 hypothetical protein CFC21_003894 [Triticum aestivum]